MNITANVEGALSTASEGLVGRIGVAVGPAIGEDDTCLWWAVELYLMIGDDGPGTALGIDHYTVVEGDDHITGGAHRNLCGHLGRRLAIVEGV